MRHADEPVNEHGDQRPDTTPYRYQPGTPQGTCPSRRLLLHRSPPPDGSYYAGYEQMQSYTSGKPLNCLSTDAESRYVHRGGARRMSPSFSTIVRQSDLVESPATMRWQDIIHRSGLRHLATMALGGSTHLATHPLAYAPNGTGTPPPSSTTGQVNLTSGTVLRVCVA
jgi:hypothetical protein